MFLNINIDDVSNSNGRLFWSFLSFWCFFGATELFMESKFDGGDYMGWIEGTTEILLDKIK